MRICRRECKKWTPQGIENVKFRMWKYRSRNSLFLQNAGGFDLPFFCLYLIERVHMSQLVRLWYLPHRRRVRPKIRHLAHWMAAHGRLKNEFTEEKSTIISWHHGSYKHFLRIFNRGMVIPTKWCVPSKDSHQHIPIVWSAFTVLMNKLWVLCYP